MKKLAAAMLALMLALSCLATLSEAADEPFLFRGIPWGISYEELKEQMELEMNSNSTTVSLNRLLERDYTNAPYSGTHFTLIAHFPDASVDAIGDVAGYQLDGITLYFARTLDEDGNIAEDEAHTALYGACYELYKDPVDPGIEKTAYEALDDLRDKLTSLYGEPEESGDITIWRGAEGTLVSLWPDRNSSNYININYVTETGDEMLKTLLDIETAKEDAFASKTNGL